MSAGSGQRVTEHRAALSADEVERLRATVPNDPVALPDGHLACEACGQKVPVGTPAVVSQAEDRTPAGRVRHLAPRGFARCPGCQARHDEAQAYVAAHPHLAGRLGDVIAVERVEAVLHGLAVLGGADVGAAGTSAHLGRRSPVADDLAFALPRLFGPSAGVRWRSGWAAVGQCAPWPWAHVQSGQRQRLRAAFGALLADRVALRQPPVPIGCPSRGCCLCGLAAVPRPAIEVARRGGVAATAALVWREVHTTTGGGGAGLTGHACPDCAAAISDEGAVGPSSLLRALAGHVGRTQGPDRARRLRALAADDCLPALPAWGSLPGVSPSAERFEHLTEALAAVRL